MNKRLARLGTTTSKPLRLTRNLTTGTHTSTLTARTFTLEVVR